jgi:hypothetical protein
MRVRRARYPRPPVPLASAANRLLERYVTTALPLAVAFLITIGAAAAESSSLGLAITSDRDPSSFGVPKSMKYQLNGEHSFESGLILGGSFQYSDRVFSNRASQNLEGTIGYNMPLNSALALNGSVGIGERWRENPDTSFPYYVLRIGANFAINQEITWNVVSCRFRDAFDTQNNYETPQLATGLTFTLDASSSISAKIMRNWRDGQPSSTGVSLGFKRRF